MTMGMTMVLMVPQKTEKRGLNMQTIKASVFKAKCLAIMDQVNQSGEEVIITKNGKPVSRLVPFRTPSKSLFGLHRGVVSSSDDLIEPLDITWDAEK
jgi:prevent-host-death family protein